MSYHCISTATMESLREAIVSAIYDPKSWDIFLEILLNATGIGHAVLSLRDLRTDRFIMPDDLQDCTGIVGWSHNSKEIYMPHFREEDYYKDLELLNPFSRSQSCNRLLGSEFEIQNSKFYNDFLKPEGVWDAVGRELFRDKNYRVFLNLYFPQEFNYAELAKLIDDLAPSINIALAANIRAFTGNIPPAAIFSEPQRSCAEITLTPNRTISARTPLAMEILAQMNCLRERHGKLVAIEEQDAKHLSTIIDAAFAFFDSGYLPDGTEHFSTTLSTSTGEIYHVTAKPSLKERGFLGAFAEPEITLTILDPGRIHSGFLVEKIKAYGLTDVEAATVVGFNFAPTINDYAVNAGIPADTVKFHLKNAYNKMGFHGKGSARQLSNLLGQLARS